MDSNVNSVGSDKGKFDDPLAGDSDLRRELAAIFQEGCPILLLEIRITTATHDEPKFEWVREGSVGGIKFQSALDATPGLEQMGNEFDGKRAVSGWKLTSGEMAQLSTKSANLTPPGPKSRDDQA